jgi:ABC-type dipeptide/oligopeptide/nickel transport system ATPase subunit
VAEPPVVVLENVSFEYVSGPAWARVRNPLLSALSLTIEPGEMVGLVGESGSGKSTIGKLCLGLLRPTTGQVRFAGEPMPRKPTPGSLAVVLQHPQWSLNPRLTVGRSVAEPLALTGVARPGRRGRVARCSSRSGWMPRLRTAIPPSCPGGSVSA